MSQNACHSIWFIWHLNPKHLSKTHTPRLWFGWMLFALQYTFFLRCILLHVFLYGISRHKLPGILSWFVASDRRLLYKLPLVARIWTHFEDTPYLHFDIWIPCKSKTKNSTCLVIYVPLAYLIHILFMFQSLKFTVIPSASFS